MSNKKNKHKGESVIGKIIYGFLLFLPLFAIGVTCLVNVFNNTEQQETTINYKYETNDVNSVEDLKIGNVYSITINNDSDFQYQLNTKTIFIEKNNNTIEINNQSSILPLNPYLQSLPSNTLIYYTTNGNSEISIVFNENTLNSHYTWNRFSKSNLTPAIESVETNGINRNDTFYKSIEQVENSNLFNWSKNSIIYTGTNEFAQAMNITNTFIPMLLAYWLIISVVYFVYDIVLMLVLIVHTKIHELQDSL